MKVAALDLGSNTFLCLIAEVEKKVITKIYADSMEVVRLGQDVEKTKSLHPEALLRAQVCLKNFKQLIDLHQPEKILAMATSAARDSSNRNELFKIAEKFQIPIEIIPGSEEARITFNGSMSGQTGTGKRLIIDIGGGSTEFIVGSLAGIDASRSLNMGCVRLTEKFITTQPTSNQEVQHLQNVISENFQQISELEGVAIEEIIAVAGTPTSLVAAEIGFYDAEQIEGHFLTSDKLLDWKNKLQKWTQAEKIKNGIPAGRADVLLVGVLILLETLKRFKKNSMKVSTRGVRHGIALEMAFRFN